ncbi:MAG: hypothetical protein K2X82_15510 [Gemmataceae bacterium]|nr:hypothetical protein [Gemmataceae bacterium]
MKRYEYDVFVPLTFNDGTPVPLAVLRGYQERLLDEFDGLTVFPQANHGFWRMGGVTYRDEIIIFRVVGSARRTARRFLTKLKEELERDLRQEEILVVERDIDTL